MVMQRGGPKSPEQRAAEVASWKAKQAEKAKREEDSGNQPVSEVRQRARARVAAETMSSQESQESERIAEEQEAAEAGYELGKNRLDDLESFEVLSETIETLLDEQADWDYLLDIQSGEVPVGESEIIKAVREKAATEEGVVNFGEIARRFLEEDLSSVRSSLEDIKQAGITIEEIRKIKELEDLFGEQFDISPKTRQRAA